MGRTRFAFLFQEKHPSKFAQKPLSEKRINGFLFFKNAKKCK
jgi:hypothetical protein